MDLHATFELAAAALAQGDLVEAERGFLELLARQPGNPQIRHPLAVTLAQQGRTAEAVEMLGAVVKSRPDDPDMLLDYGVILREAGRFEEALAAFDHALAVQPGNPDLMKLRGDTLVSLKRADEALASYDRILAFRPNTAMLQHSRGNALRALGRHDEAVTSFDRALALEPDFTPALYDRGTSLAARHRIAEWFAGFARFTQRWVGAKSWSAFGDNDAPPPAHQAQHDSEQRAYHKVMGIKLTGERPHIESGARLSGPAINPDNAPAAAKAWRDSRPQIVVIDNLLTDEALDAMRRYCWGSTMWRSAYDGGYIGAFPEQGFAAPLLAQIVEEFRTAFSDICGEHALKYVWGFKYDSAMDGIGIHADAAAVNVNFWITPDEANLDPDHGGLVVWDKAAPLDWDFNTFNTDEGAIRDFLAESGARPVTIPYRANRAVIFDSDLFHQTDVIRFKPGYENRRINVTLLYGERAPGALG